MNTCRNACPYISSVLRYVGINNRCTLYDKEIEPNRKDYSNTSVSGLDEYKPYYRCNECKENENG